MSPDPGRIESEIAVTLPRPRDVMSAEFKESNVTRAIKAASKVLPRHANPDRMGFSEGTTTTRSNRT